VYTCSRSAAFVVAGNEEGEGMVSCGSYVK
jgi:hypothetical protein